MTNDRDDDRSHRHDDRDGDSERVPTDRESPVGAPVIRGDESVTGSHAQRAIQFDPDDPESLADAVTIVRRFAGETTGDEDPLYMLRGAAACAALVRGEGSYKAAAERVSRHGDDGEAPSSVGISFIRKWARVHDLPRSVRRQVALGKIAPSAAKHIARVAGESRLLLAWATIDADLTVREVRSVASDVNDGTTIEAALAEHDVELGRIDIVLPAEAYRDLRRVASNEGVRPGAIVGDALESYLESD